MKIATPAPCVDDAFMQAYFSAFKRRDLQALKDMITDDVVLESAFGPEIHGKRFVGKQSFCDAVTRYFEALPNVASSDRSYCIIGDKGITEFTVAYDGPDKKRVTMRVCDLFDFRDGKIASKRAYSKRVQAEVGAE